MDSRSSDAVSSGLDELYRAERHLLQRFLRRFGDGVSPEDISQESFARLCAIDAAHIDSPRAYLFRTARNLALNALRGHQKAPIRAVANPEAFAAANDAPSPEERLTAIEDVERLNRAIATLAPHKREALLLFRVEGWSYRAIGAELGVSHRTVERYVADALAHCHLALAEMHTEDTSEQDR